MADAKLITRDTLAAEAASAWDWQYRNYGADTDKAAIGRALRELGAKPDPDAVDAAIGNGSWTTVPRCNGCGAESMPFVVQVGEQPDYDSATVNLCGLCVAEAAMLLDRGAA